MDAEVSSFEPSEMLATLLASTPLLEESWKLCGEANSSAPQSYLTKEIDDVCYVAFSGVQILAGLDPDCRYLVPIDGFRFSALQRQGEEEEETVMVHAGLLHLFLSFYNNPIFQNQKMPITMKTPFMPKTEDQRRRLRLLENSLDTIKLEASVRTDDLDRVVDHIVRVNVVIQQCIWHGGFRLGRDDKAVYGKLASSFKNKFLKELAVRSWRDPEGSFHQALRRFFKMFFSLGVRRTRDHEDLLKLRRDRCAARVIEGEVIYSFPADLEWKVKESLPVRKYFK